MVPVFLALDLARDGICSVFAQYGRDVRDLFDPLQVALEKAVYEQDQPAE